MVVYIVIGVLCIGLIGSVWYISRLKKYMTERQATTKEWHQKEIAAAEEDFRSSYQEQENEWLEELRDFELQYTNDIQTLNNHIGKLTQNIIDLQNYSRNPGEIIRDC